MQGGKGTGGPYNNPGTITYPLAFTDESSITLIGSATTPSLTGSNHSVVVHFGRIYTTTAKAYTGYNGNSSEARPFNWVAFGY